MRKYWAMYLIALQNAFVYRGSSILWRIGSLLNLMIFAFMWLSAESRGLVAGFNRTELITYYLLAVFLSSVVYWYPARGIEEEINKGVLAMQYLMKPISYYGSKFFQDFAWHTISPVFGSISFMVGLLLLRNYVSLTVSPPTLLLMTIAVISAGILCFNISYFLGLLAFFTTEIEASTHFLWLGTALFGGESVPVAFFGGMLHNLVVVLPFRYIFSFPLEIYFGRLSSLDVLIGFLVAWFWAILFYGLDRWLWREGLRRYTAYGG